MVISHENHHMFHGKPSQFGGICNKNHPSQLQKKTGELQFVGELPLFNSSPWKIPMLFLERYGPSISMPSKTHGLPCECHVITSLAILQEVTS
jgi:hypothetical protein